MINKWLSSTVIFFLYLLSLLPLRLLYVIANLLFVVLYYIISYRRTVVRENLYNSFPEKSADERRIIEKKYYKYLADLLVETIKSISISEEEINRRMISLNPEMLPYYFNKGKSIIAVCGHYGNWELAALKCGLVTDKRRVIVYKPLSDKTFDDFFKKTRSRFGCTMVAMKMALRKMIEYRAELSLNILVGDQTPVKEETQYFTQFLNQPTAMFLGIEKLAKVIDAAVVFCKIDVVKRGYYTYTWLPLIEEPKLALPYAITESHVNCLENIIKARPEYWLWSHRRWKIKQ
jgi:KDO2-lipid IV(A) lauroyltransferase